MWPNKLPPGVVAKFIDKPVRPDDLFSEEQDISRKYDQRRYHDFAKGRHCAHLCLRVFKQEQCVGKNIDGSPIWPVGFTGSISHSQPLAGAILSRKDDYSSIGLDIEKMGRITPDLWPLLYSESELSYLSAQPIELQEEFSTAMYSLKEAYYKMQFPLFKIGLEHKDLEINFQRRGKGILIRNKTVYGKLNKLNTVINYEVKEAFVISYVLLLH